MNSKVLSLALVLMAVTSTSRVLAQGVAVNASGSPVDASAMLDVSATDKGMLVPRMTSAQRIGISNPATGLLVYQTDGTSGFYYNSGTPSVPAWTLLSGGAPTGSAGGDLTGTYPNPTLKVTAVTAGSYGSATQVPTYTVDSKGRVTSASNTTITGVAPGGSAGGDLTGTYPNPSIATTATTGNNIVSALVNATTGTIPTARLGSSSGSSAQYLDGTGAFTTPVTPTNNIFWNTFWEPSSGLGARYYAFPGPGVSGITAPLTANASPMAGACIIDALYLHGQTRIPGQANTYTVTLYKNGTATSITCSITTNGATGALFNVSDIAHSVSVTAGDLLEIRVDETNGVLGDLVRFSWGWHGY